MHTSSDWWYFSYTHVLIHTYTLGMNENRSDTMYIIIHQYLYNCAQVDKNHKEKKSTAFSKWQPQYPMQNYNIKVVTGEVEKNTQ